MPNDVADFTGRMATVTGWGRLKYGGGVPSVLQEVQVIVLFLHQTSKNPENPAFHDHIFCCYFLFCFFICLGANYRKQCMPGNVPHSWT